jgi:hypothetical protein
MNYTIYRYSWRRGGNAFDREHGDTSLYNSESQRMCCLGQCAFQAGVPLEVLEDTAEPDEIGTAEYSPLVSGGLLTGPDEDDPHRSNRNSQFSREAIQINDSGISDEAREALLISLAAKHGHTLTFVDGVAPWFEEVA